MLLKLDRHTGTCARMLWQDVQTVRNGDLSLRAFARDFFLDNREIKSNKERRWRVFLRAERNGVLLDRPRVAPLWKPYKVYHEPMFDVYVGPGVFNKYCC